MAMTGRLRFDETVTFRPNGKHLVFSDLSLSLDLFILSAVILTCI